MKPRAILLVVGIAAIVGIGAFAAWKSPWVKSWFARDTENPAEIDRARKEQPKNVAPPGAESGSPQWRGASRQGIAPAGSFRTDWDMNPPKEVWRAPIGGGYGSCSIVDGRLYVQDRREDQDRVVCLEAETGKLIWQYAYAAGPAGSDPQYAIGPRATPSVDGNLIFSVGGDGTLIALETDGETVIKKWERKLLSEFNAPLPRWGVACSPLVLDDLVIVMPGGRDGAVAAFNKHNGELRWAAGSNPPGYSSPVAAPIGGQMTVFAFMGNALLAIRPTDGTLTDSYKWNTDHEANIATPLVIGDYVFISAAYHSGCALLRAEKNGDEVKFVEVYAHRRRGFQNHIATSVYKDGHLYGIHGTSGSGGLKCYTFADGVEVEDWGDQRIGQATMILAGDHLILQSERGELLLVEANPEEYRLISKTPRLLSGRNNWATPTLIDGRLYLRDEQNVVCFDIKQ